MLLCTEGNAFCLPFKLNQYSSVPRARNSIVDIYDAWEGRCGKGFVAQFDYWKDDMRQCPVCAAGLLGRTVRVDARVSRTQIYAGSGNASLRPSY